MDWKEYNEKMKFQKTRREYQKMGIVEAVHSLAQRVHEKCSGRNMENACLSCEKSHFMKAI